MATLTITTTDGTSNHTLGAVALVGRHWACAARINAPGMPLHWIELRWRGRVWAWRVLAAEDKTRGTGDVLESGWRALTEHTGRIRLDADVTVVLSEGGPPLLHAIDLIDGRVHVGEALDQLIDHGSNGAFSLEADGVVGRRLADGDVFVVDGRPYRMIGDAWVAATAQGRVQVRHPRLRCDVDPAGEVAVFTVGARSAVVRSAAVRILLVYVTARLVDDPDGGWRTADTAWAAWVGLGGPSTSSPERLGWEKGRLRSAITRGGLVDAGGLFETRRRDGAVVSRVALPPTRLAISKIDE